MIGILYEYEPKDELINDFKKLRNWSQIMKDREAWNDRVQRPKPM
jgi:hypothetical protein